MDNKTQQNCIQIKPEPSPPIPIPKTPRKTKEQISAWFQAGSEEIKVDEIVKKYKTSSLKNLALCLDPSALHESDCQWDNYIEDNESEEENNEKYLLKTSVQTSKSFTEKKNARQTRDQLLHNETSADHESLDISSVDSCYQDFEYNASKMRRKKLSSCQLL